MARPQCDTHPCYGSQGFIILFGFMVGMLERHCDAPNKWAKSFVSLHSRVMYASLPEGSIHLGLHHANHHVLCFQFSMLNVYHPYGSHLKGRAIKVTSHFVFLIMVGGHI
jgi:hypothetical protein